MADLVNNFKLASLKNDIDTCIGNNVEATDNIASNMQETFDNAILDSDKESLIIYALEEVIKQRNSKNIAIFAATVAAKNPEINNFVKASAYSVNTKIWGNNKNEGGSELYAKINNDLRKVLGQEQQPI